MQFENWERTVEEIGPKLFRYFKYKGASEHASDLTQEVFMRLLEVGSRYDRDKGALTSFAFGIAQNVWRESARRLKSFDDVSELDVPSEHDLAASLEGQDQAQHLRRLVEGLSPAQQDILYLYFDEQMTTRQISEVLHMPEGTVKSHLHRGKEELRVRIERDWK